MFSAPRLPHWINRGPLCDISKRIQQVKVSLNSSMYKLYLIHDELAVTGTFPWIDMPCDTSSGGRIGKSIRNDLLNTPCLNNRKLVLVFFRLPVDIHISTDSRSHDLACAFTSFVNSVDNHN